MQAENAAKSDKPLTSLLGTQVLQPWKSVEVHPMMGQIRQNHYTLSCSGLQSSYKPQQPKILLVSWKYYHEEYENGEREEGRKRAEEQIKFI